MSAPPGEFESTLRYARWCGLLVICWLVVDCVPATHAYPLALAFVNVLFTIMLVPALLGMFAILCLVNENYEGILHCLSPALVISEALNLIPNNPFALGLPDFALTETIALLSLDRYAEASEVTGRLLKNGRSMKKIGALKAARVKLLHGIALAGLGKFGEGEKITRLALAEMEGQTGAKPADTAASMADLAAMLSRIGKSKAAIELGNRAIQLQEQAPPPENADKLPPPHSQAHLVQLAMVINNVAVCYDDAGHYQRAQDLYQRSLNIKLRVFGEKSRHSVIGYSNLGCALLNQGQYYRALENCEKAKNIAIELNLQDSRLWPEVLCNCGDAHRGVGRLDEAEQELLESLKEREKKKDPQIHETWHEIAKLYTDKGDLAKAESFFRKALDLREKRFGKDHPKLARTLVEFAKLLRMQNRQQEAEQTELRVSVIQEQLDKDLAQ